MRTVEHDDRFMLRGMTAHDRHRIIVCPIIVRLHRALSMYISTPTSIVVRLIHVPSAFSLASLNFEHRVGATIPFYTHTRALVL